MYFRPPWHLQPVRFYIEPGGERRRLGPLVMASAGSNSIATLLVYWKHPGRSGAAYNLHSLCVGGIAMVAHRTLTDYFSTPRKL